MVYWKSNYNPAAAQGEESPGVSKYNSAQLINQRMHELWLECKKNWRNGYMKELNDILDVVYTELYADSTPEHREQIKQYDSNISKYEIEIQKCKDRNSLNATKLKYVLEIKQKWLFLKCLEKKQGIGKSYKDEFEDDFD